MLRPTLLADLKAAGETLETLGVDKSHPSPVVPVYSPISGVIVQQNVTNAAAAGVTYSGSATAFTVADLSVVWVICDVYENDIPKLALGQLAQIKLNAYPDRPLTGHISDIGPVLDPAIRTAKVRIEVAESTHTQDRHVCHRSLSKVCRRSTSRWFPHRLFSICMTVTGSLYPRAATSSAESRLRPARWWATSRQFSPVFRAGSRLSPTCFSLKQRWRRNDPGPRRFCTQKSSDRACVWQS